jgi:diketogulonate reductase-like aldo/keto reductase
MAKTNQERLQALREKREKMGLKRFDVYLHPSEWPLVKRYIERLAKRRNAK